jgi:small-conductance mechanosensitive channel
MKRYIYTCVLLLVTAVSIIKAQEAVDDILNKVGVTLHKQSRKIFIDVREEKREQKVQLEQEKKVLEQSTAAFEENIHTQLQSVEAGIAQVKSALQRNPDDQFLNKKLSVLNELYQAYKDWQKEREQLIAIIDEHIKSLNTYLEDMDLAQFKKEHKFKDYLIYSYDDLQYFSKTALDQEKRVAQLAEQEKSVKNELTLRKQSAAAATQAYQQKKEEREQAIRGKTSGDRLKTSQVVELLHLEEQLYNVRQELDELRVDEIEHKAALIDAKKFVAEIHLQALKDELRRIRPLIKISEHDLVIAKEELARKRQEHVEAQEIYRKQLNIILAEKQEKEKLLEVLSKRYNVALGEALDEWRVEPQRTVNAYVGLCQVGAVNSYLLYLDAHRQVFDLQGTLEDMRLSTDAVKVQIKETFYKIMTRAFVTQESIAQEIQKYDAPLAEAKANLSLYQTKKNEIDELIVQQKEILRAMMRIRRDIHKQKTELFKSAVKEYMVCVDMLTKAEHAIKDRTEALNKMSTMYGAIIETINDTLRHINFVITELNAITVWHRPEYAISWQGVQHIIPDLKIFLSDIGAYIHRFNMNIFMVTLKDSFRYPYQALLLCIKLLILLICLFVLRIYGPSLSMVLLQRSQEQSEFMRMITRLVAPMLSFFNYYFIPITVWTMLFAFMMFQGILDPYVYIIFYLCSIPYLLYLTNRFIVYLLAFNVDHGYVILSRDFQHRFTIVVSVLLYATVTIVFFREAFMLANYYHSEVPTILLAFNFIVFQVALIFLITKEQILSLIPMRSDLWQFIREKVDRYYALILLMAITIIILSNPYVGFGRLVLHMLSAVVYTGLLIASLFWLHGVFKRVASRVFFSREEEIVRERFPQAKTWFGLLIICSFMTVIIVGFVIGARIWSWPLAFADMGVWLHQPLVSGMKPPITVLSILQLIGFVMAGFIVSYLLNSFVLDKIFDLLLIEMGVQHTVTSILRYIIVIAAIFLGFQQVGLGALVVYAMGALALGIGWILKEPISDFIAYFIILVQRPIKIGDYIQLDENTVGIVRTITTRAVVLRRKNSTSIIVPNSYMINRSIVNWNYVRKFVAIDDILVTVSFYEDPVKIRQLLFQALEEHPNILRNPKPIVRLNEFGEYGYVFMVRGFVSDAYVLDIWDIAADIRMSVAKKLRENNVQLAERLFGAVDRNVPADSGDKGFMSAPTEGGKGHE